MVEFIYFVKWKDYERELIHLKNFNYKIHIIFSNSYCFYISLTSDIIIVTLWTGKFGVKKVEINKKIEEIGFPQGWLIRTVIWA